MDAAADIGIAGLGAMGRNLALQAADKGLAVAVWDGWADARAGWDAANPSVPAHADLPAFAARLAQPRRILLLVKAGEPTGALIEALAPHLSPGDILADLGNAHFRDTEVRQERLARGGIHLLGIGISGGAEGARAGASFMAGGDSGAWRALVPAIEALAARADDRPTAARFGSGGAGHYVKMVHNGIEYAEMQALAECRLALREANGLDADAAARWFERWNEGLGESFLTALAARVLRARDETGAPLIDDVLDQAGQKGTGRWTIEEALELGVPVPTLAEALFARGLSAEVEGRRAAAAALPRPAGAGPVPSEALGEALLATRICAFAQGFALLTAAARVHGWAIDLAAVAEVWRAGCILRGAILPEIAAACREAPEAPNLITAPRIAAVLNEAQPGWREAVAACQAAGIPVPALASALAWRDGWATARSGADLIAAQRDAFGAHGFRRRGRDGAFHAEWSGR